VNRKPILLTILTACLAATAMLATPSASAYSRNYDCTKDRKVIYIARHYNAYSTQSYNYFNSHATAIVDKCIAKLAENEGASPQILHSIAADCETYLGYIALEAEYYLYHIRNVYIMGDFEGCPRTFGRSAAYNRSLVKRLNIRQAELRDQLKAALFNALNAG
jgi:hypothetical protein